MKQIARQRLAVDAARSRGCRWRNVLRSGVDPRFGATDVQPLLDELLRRLTDAVGDRLLAVALFGSVARGDATSASDIDLVVVHAGSRREMADAFVQVVLALRSQPSGARAGALLRT